MASRLKWLGVAAAAVLLVMPPLLLPRLVEDIPTSEVNRLAALRNRTGNMLSRARMTLFELEHADSILRHLPASDSVKVVLPSFLPDTSEARIRAHLDTVLAPLESPRARVLIMARAVGPGTDLDLYRSRLELGAYTGTDERGPYCAFVHNMRDTDPASPSATRVFEPERGRVASHQLKIPGGCYFWGRYGAPGRLIDEWLKDTNYAMAQLPAEYPWRNDSHWMRSIFGVGHLDIVQRMREGCGSGIDDACTFLAELVTVRRDENSPIAYYFDGHEWIGQNESAIAGVLEQQFGEERFARFWRSDEDMQTAFAAAFGVPFTEWMQTWIQDRFEVVPPGPQLRLSDVLLSLLTLGALAAAALMVAQRRQVR